MVTGGGSGIGPPTCRRMAEEGARVAVFDVNEESAKAVAGEIEGPRTGSTSATPRRCAPRWTRWRREARRAVDHLQQRRDRRLQQAA